MEQLDANQRQTSRNALDVLSLIEDGLDALALGVGIFDRDLRLIDCNGLFRKIRGYPASFCQVGTRLADILDHDLRCGQLGGNESENPVDLWLDRAKRRQRHSAELEIDPGHAVAMALMPVDEGNILLTFADVSERRRAERSLRANQEWLELVTEASSEGVYDWNVSTNDLTASYRLTAMLGLSPGSLTSSDWNERIHPQCFARYREAIANHFKGESQYFKCEYQIRRHSGDYIWLSDSGKCVRDKFGKAIRLVGAVSDITSRKLAETSLEKSEARYALAMQATDEGIYDWDIGSNKTYYSEGVRAALGLEPDMLKTAEDWIDRIHADDIAGWRHALVSHFKKEARRFEAEFRYRGAGDEWRWARQHGIAQFDENGRAVRMIGTTGDITALKTAEMALRESEDRYALAAEAATEGLYDWDVAADRLIVSDRLNAIMDLPSGALSSHEWNKRLHRNDRQKYRAAMQAHFRGETRYFACEYRARNGAGDYIWISDNAKSVRNAQGRVVRMVGAIADVTERRRADEELREARQRAEDASLLAIEKAQMLESLSTKLSKYLSPQVYSSIFSGQQSVLIEAKRKKLTIFFSDIVGFTSIADMLESEDLTVLLNDYLTEMSLIASEYGATIDKFIGDAILAFFGDPDSKGSRGDALACVRMAIAMQRRMREMQAGWREKGLEKAFELRIGITTGFCTVGNFGSEDRMDYTVIGNEVNRAARLQNHAETGGIILSSETHALVKDEIAAADQGEIALRGILRPVRAYKVLGIYDDLAEVGQIIRIDQPGLRVLLNPEELTGESRIEALKALEHAVARLKRKKG